MYCHLFHELTNSSLDTSQFGNETVLTYTKKYLDVGESTFDFASAWLSSSGYFKR